MGDFANYNMTYHIELDDKTIYGKIKPSLSKLGLSYIDSEDQIASICILDASLYFAKKSFYDKKYEACLKVLTKDNYVQYYDRIFSGFGFSIRAEFTVNELEEIILTIRDYLSAKFKNQILETVFDSANNSLVITNNKGVIQYANKYFLNATGYENDEVLGGLPKLIKSGFHNEEFYKEMWDAITRGHVWSGFFVNQRKDGRRFYEEATISPIFNSLGQAENFLKIGKMVEREHLLSKELSQEMKIASEVMDYMLPADYSDKYISFKSKIKAYNYLGGDYVCFQKIGKHKYSLGIIDVVGHGMSSTLIGMKAISIFQSVIHYDSLENTVNRINRSINIINEHDVSTVRYLSGIFMIIDFKEEVVSYVNAGHPAFYVKTKKELMKFESNNIILGIINQKEFLEESIPLKDMSYIFLYSDGLIENNEEELKVAGCHLEQALEEAEGKDQAFMDLVLDKMIGNREYTDDITLCYVEFT